MKFGATKTAVMCVLALVVAVSARAKGTPGVANTMHNLSVTGVDYKFGNTPGTSCYSFPPNNVSEICVFCHTPHGGLTQGPLWNRNLPAATGTFTHYSSSTLTIHNVGGYTSGRAVGDESRLCMSCHDGSATLDILAQVAWVQGHDLGSLPRQVGG